MRIATLLLLLALPSLAAPPNGWSATFQATVTLTGTAKRETFAWEDVGSWRADDGQWNIELLPSDPPFRADFLLFELNSNVNAIAYLDAEGRFDVGREDPGFFISDASTTFAVPEPPILLGLVGVGMMRRKR